MHSYDAAVDVSLALIAVFTLALIDAGVIAF
jgi:hypothetical protein